ncbi:MAG: ribonuclease P protein subunit [Treponema sp.]|nr:ribonuclease P protein subunit [Treponema sp.]
MFILSINGIKGMFVVELSNVWIFGTEQEARRIVPKKNAIICFIVNYTPQIIFLSIDLFGNSVSSRTSPAFFRAERLPTAISALQKCFFIGIRRFCGCDKGTRSVPATGKMRRRKNPQRA